MIDMAGSGRGTIRASGKGPTVLVIGLVIVVIIVAFNYWSLSRKNAELLHQISDIEAQLRISIMRRDNLEKRNADLAQKVRDHEETKEKNRVAQAQRDQEMNELSGKLQRKTDELSVQKSLVQEVDEKYQQRNAETLTLKETLDSCERGSAKLRLQVQDLQSAPPQACTDAACADVTQRQTQRLASQVDALVQSCGPAVQQTLKSFFASLLPTGSQQARAQNLVDSYQQNQGYQQPQQQQQQNQGFQQPQQQGFQQQQQQNPNQGFQQPQQQQQQGFQQPQQQQGFQQSQQAPLAPRCSLAPDPGPCRAIFKKFYFDPVSRTCQGFVYGGCQGNANNFESVDQCESTCLHAQAASGNETRPTGRAREPAVSASVPAADKVEESLNSNKTIGDQEQRIENSPSVAPAVDDATEVASASVVTVKSSAVDTPSATTEVDSTSLSGSEQGASASQPDNAVHIDVNVDRNRIAHHAQESLHEPEKPARSSNVDAKAPLKEVQAPVKEESDGAANHAHDVDDSEHAHAVQPAEDKDSAQVAAPNEHGAGVRDAPRDPLVHAPAGGSDDELGQDEGLETDEKHLSNGDEVAADADDSNMAPGQRKAEVEVFDSNQKEVQHIAPPPGDEAVARKNADSFRNPNLPSMN